MTLWDYLSACCTIAKRQGVKLLVRWDGRSLWGRALDCGRIGDVCYLRIDLDINKTIYITHREVIKFSEEGEEKQWPRYENDGQTRLF